MFKTILNNFHLEKLIWIIKSKLTYMVLAGLLCAMLAGAFASVTRTVTYQAEISFYVYSNPDYAQDNGVNLSSSEIAQANTLLASYMQILYSNSFLNKIIEETGLENYTTSALQKRISATSVSDTAVFEVRVLDENPLNAMLIANAIGELAPDEITRIVKSGGLEVLDEAELPTEPYASTSVFMYALLGGAAGFVLVAVWAVVKGLLNTTIRRPYEIEDLFTIPILGAVPLLLPEKENRKASALLEDGSSFALKEAYSNIRMNLLFMKTEEKCPVYAVTSADCEEGKTFNALNLGAAFAQLGRKVLVIDADMRRSSMAELLELNDLKEGLSEYLEGITKEVSVLHRTENLDIILAGILPPNPAELLVYDKWYELLEKSKEEYDVIFVDLPSLGIVSDALSMAQTATAYILVVREQMTHFEREEMIVRKLEAVDADICGFIYNGMSTTSPDYNFKRYGKEYEN